MLFKNYNVKSLLVLVYLLINAPGYSQSIQDWYDDSQKRIDTLRKGHFSVQIYDKDGQLFEGPVKVKMVKHEFPFGIAFDFYEGDIQTEVPTETQWMKAAMYKYFNYGVSGNSFKWSGIQPQPTAPDYTNFENALNWTQKVGWELRAHTLLWGGTSYEDDHPTPRWVKDLDGPEAILAALEERVKREVSRYKGLIKEYDVINEPVHATYLQSLVGDSLNWKSFQWARETDPDAELFINEYNVEYGWGDADKYKALIEEVISNGGPVTGIGMQAHFWDCCRPNITEFVTQINTLAEIGLPIKLTEFDYGGNLSEAEQAADFVKVATIAFSHPSINGMISWALSDRGAWRENTGYFTADHRPKIAADSLLYLTKVKWATNFNSTYAGETMAFDAYYGDYIVEVEFEGGVKEFSLSLLKENKGMEFHLYEEDGDIKAPELVEARLNELDELFLIYDKSIEQSSIDKKDFRVFTENSISITDIGVLSDADSVLLLNLSADIPITDYPTVSYFPGSLTSTDGGIARAFGTEHINFPSALNKAPRINDQSFSLQAYSARGTFIGYVLAHDPENMPVRYKILPVENSDAFSINENTGRLAVANDISPDYEKNNSFELLVEVSDGVNTTQATITINILNVTGIEGFSMGQVHIFPNPTSGVLNVSSGVGFRNIEIYDMKGDLVYYKNYQRSTFEDTIIPPITQGVYVIKLINRNDVKTFKVILK